MGVMKHSNPLNEINKSIDLMHSHVLVDFNKVVNLVTHNKLNDKLKGRLADIVKELQYYDIIHQKLQHIKCIHDWIDKGITTENSVSSAVEVTNLIRLNFLQFQLSYFDYTTAVESIKSAISLEMPLHLEDTVLLNIFEECVEIMKGAETVNEKLLQAEKELQGMCEVFVKPNLEKLSSLYSMECERSVLQAYLKDPFIAPEVIKTMSANSHQNDQSIELF